MPAGLWPRAVALALLLAAVPVWAKPLSVSPRPLPRPALPAAALPAAVPPAAVPAATVPPATVPPATVPPAATLQTLPQTLPPALRPQVVVLVPQPGTIHPRPKPALPRNATKADPAPVLPAPQLAGIRPLPRPKGLGLAAAPTPGAVAVAPRRGLFGSAKPAAKPEPSPSKPASAKGSVCGVAGIIGQKIPPIPGKIKGCGLAEGVRLTSVSGIRLSQPLTVDCPTAIALKRWIDKGIGPAVGGKGGGLAALEVGPGYVCRPRNNVRGATVSEHGRGKAIDLMGLTLANGQRIDVLKGWKSQPKLLKAIHASACGPFGTVLGPKSDRYHQNHIHVDTARYRSGPYCR